MDFSSHDAPFPAMSDLNGPEWEVKKIKLSYYKPVVLNWWLWKCFHRYSFTQNNAHSAWSCLQSSIWIQTYWTAREVCNNCISKVSTARLHINLTSFICRRHAQQLHSLNLAHEFEWSSGGYRCMTFARPLSRLARAIRHHGGQTKYNALCGSIS